MSSDNRGYTLAELVIVMMIFSIVMAMIALSFSNIVKHSSVVVKSIETDIGGLIGLELLRGDLEAAGFGLPWSLPREVSYRETSLGETVPGYPGTAASSYNEPPNPEDPDSPSPPKAYQNGDGVGFNGSDYIVLKGTAVGMSRTSRSWGYLNYSSTGTIVRQSKSGLELDKDDRAIMLKQVVKSGVVTRELATAAPNSATYMLLYGYPLQSGFRPQGKEESFLVYGVAPPEEAALTFPYNRADYYIRPTSAADDNPPGGENCAPKTGTLYKTTMDHSGGRTLYPLLDCVADLQLLFVLGDGGRLTHFDEEIHDAAFVRENLKELRLYVMAQQGKFDPGYHFPMPDPDKVLSLGHERNWTRSEFLRNGWEHYHWKVYTIVVQPKNL